MSQRDDSDGTKKCPACAEQVQSEAIVCRYCGHDFRRQRVGRGSPSSRLLRVALITFLVGVLLIILGVVAAANPQTNIPVVSPLVCNMKGAVWIENKSFFDPPTGCYADSALDSTESDIPEDEGNCDEGYIYFSGDGLFDEGCYTPEELGEG